MSVSLCMFGRDHSLFLSFNNSSFAYYPLCNIMLCLQRACWCVFIFIMHYIHPNENNKLFQTETQSSFELVFNIEDFYSLNVQRCNHNFDQTEYFTSPKKHSKMLSNVSAASEI